MLGLSLLSVLLLSASVSSTSLRRSRYGCEGTVLQLECEPGTVISPVRANYGRFSSSVCNPTSNSQWSTRCIQPTTLRQVNSLCGGRGLCSIDVTSAVLGEPCPETYKYLEVHYTCVPEQASSHTARENSPALPPWLLEMTATTSAPGAAGAPRADLTSTPAPTTTTTTERFEYVEEVIVSMEDSEDIEDEEEVREVYINLPYYEADYPTTAPLPVEVEDRTVLIATLVSLVSCSLVIIASALVYTRCRQRRKQLPSSSSSTLPEYDYSSASSNSSTVSSVYSSAQEKGGLPSVYTTLSSGHCSPLHHYTASTSQQQPLSSVYTSLQQQQQPLSSVYTTLPNGQQALLIPITSPAFFAHNFAHLAPPAGQYSETTAAAATGQEAENVYFEIDPKEFLRY